MIVNNINFFYQLDLDIRMRLLAKLTVEYGFTNLINALRREAREEYAPLMIDKNAWGTKMLNYSKYYIDRLNASSITNTKK